MDHLFGRLHVRYGAAFARQWPDLDIEAVKADWADVLDGTSGDSIGYALRYLPTERPPNALQFRDLCRRAPTRQDVPKLTHKANASDEVVRRVMAALRQHTDGPATRPAVRCAMAIAESVQRNGGKLSPPQRAQLLAMRDLLVGTEAEDAADV